MPLIIILIKQRLLLFQDQVKLLVIKVPLVLLIQVLFWTLPISSVQMNALVTSALLALLDLNKQVSNHTHLVYSMTCSVNFQLVLYFNLNSMCRGHRIGLIYSLQKFTKIHTNLYIFKGFIYDQGSSCTQNWVREISSMIRGSHVIDRGKRTSFL